MSDLPPLFEKIPESLFVPLASPLKPIYWEALMVAFRLHLDPDRLEIGKESLLDQVEEHLWESGCEPEEPEAVGEDGEPANYSETRLFAWRVLRQLERCGWLEYEYHRDLGQVLRFPDYALYLLKALEEIARGERPRVQGLAYNVKQILTDAEQKENDPGFVLYQAKGAVAALVRELKLLAANIGRYVERAAEREEVRDLLALQMNEFWPKVVEPSYQRFKTSDNVLKFRVEILDRLEELANDPLFVQEAAARVEVEDNLEPEQAKDRVYDWLEDMSAEIRAIDDLIEEIDSRHARYVGLTLERIRHRLYRSESTETRLVEMIGRLAALPSAAEDLWEDLLEAYQIQHAGEDSLYRVPGESEPHEPEPVAIADFSAEARRLLLAQAQDSFSSPISREAIFAEVGEILSREDQLELASLPVADDAEFLRLIALHSYRNDDAAPYELEIDDQAPLVRSGNYLFRAGTIKRRSPEAD